VESEGLLSKLKGLFHREGGGHFGHRGDSCGCDTGCASSCDTCGRSHFSGFRFGHRDSCGCDTGCASSCNTCGGSHFGGSRFGHRDSCGCDTGCASSCDSCGGSHFGGFREKFRGLFHRTNNCGCNTCGGCADGGCGTVIITPAPGTMKQAEPIGQPKEEPKKLPSGTPEKEKKPGSVQLIPQPVDIPELQVAPTSGKSPF
jgi:hypothetical protein